MNCGQTDREGPEVVCPDTKCVIAYLAGKQSADVEFLDKLLERKIVVMAPVVVAELLSDPTLPAVAEGFIRSLPEMGAGPGYSPRAGKLRAVLAEKGFKARLADTLIAQSCLDHDVPLLTRGQGFRRFVKLGLRLV